MRYYIADCHFWHKNVINYFDHRQFESVEDMNEYMVEKWNSKVRKKDEVVILGDLSTGNAEQTMDVLRRLHGRLWLCVGNHDRYLKMKGFDTSRFFKIDNYLELNDDKRKVICCHYPICEYNGMYRKMENGEPKTYMLYGHIHDTESNIYIKNYREMVKTIPRSIYRSDEPELVKANMINCFCMYSDYTPLTLDEWIENDKIRQG